MLKRPDLDSTLIPTNLDWHRAAGWWAGEGSVSSTGRKLSATVAQKEVAVLHWLKDRFGGSIAQRKPSAPHLAPCSVWTVNGPRARRFLLGIYGRLPESPRRRAQIKAAILATVGERKRGPKPSEFCRRGHSKGPHGDCRVCANDSLRRWRAKPGVAEQRRRAEMARYYKKKELKGANGTRGLVGE